MTDSCSLFVFSNSIRYLCLSFDKAVKCKVVSTIKEILHRQGLVRRCLRYPMLARLIRDIDFRFLQPICRLLQIQVWLCLCEELSSVLLESSAASFRSAIPLIRIFFAIHSYISCGIAPSIGVEWKDNQSFWIRVLRTFRPFPFFSLVSHFSFSIISNLGWTPFLMNRLP